MTKNKLSEVQNDSNDLNFLDDLIAIFYKKLKKQLNEEENLKLGDFLKMVELRRKLTPDKNSQKKFWDLLENIRKQTAENNMKEIKKQKSKTSNKSKQK
ncbi:MAG: hypothetical protein DRP35_03180 [Candidatus Zixiibacteriota bacterium]|nr:MAG: hypothetical protein DRP35_03180 [candidate division Zixibacteria bacterium]